MSIIFSNIESDAYDGINHFRDDDSKESDDRNMSCHFETNEDNDNCIKHFSDD